MKNKPTNRLGLAIALIAVTALVLTACAHEQKGLERLNYLVSNGGSARFTQPPSEGETVLETFNNSYLESSSGRFHKAVADITPKYGVTAYHKVSAFSANRAAGVLLGQAVKKHPDIDVNELDVRSVVYTGNWYYGITISPPDKNNMCNYTATTGLQFTGVVVRLK